MNVDRFSWVVEGKLAGCAFPSLWFDGDDAEWLAGQGISMLVSFARLSGWAEEECKSHGIELVICEIDGNSVPESAWQKKLFQETINKVVAAMKKGRGACLHCQYGVGRTGMGLACALGVYEALPADQAIKKVRKERGYSQEDLDWYSLPSRQDRFVKEFLGN
jgi:protein tyrosine/serine phosphatase